MLYLQCSLWIGALNCIVTCTSTGMSTTRGLDCNMCSWFDWKHHIFQLLLWCLMALLIVTCSFSNKQTALFSCCSLFWPISCCSSWILLLFQSLHCCSVSQSKQTECPKGRLSLNDQPAGKCWLAKTNSCKLGWYEEAALPVATVHSLQHRDTDVSQRGWCV